MRSRTSEGSINSTTIPQEKVKPCERKLRYSYNAWLDDFKYWPNVKKRLKVYYEEFLRPP